MRGLMTLVGLLITLAVVAWLVRQQMTAAPKPALLAPSGGANNSGTSATDNVMQQSQQMQQSYKQAIEGAMQARPMPDDK